MLSSSHNRLPIRHRIISISILVLAMTCVVIGMAKLSHAFPMESVFNSIVTYENEDDRSKLDMRRQEEKEPTNRKGGTNSTENSLELQVLDTSAIPSQKLMTNAANRWKGDFVTDSEFDLNKDGVSDLALQSKFESAGLGQYFVVSRFVSLNGTKLLKRGEPQSNGSKISVVDLLAPSTNVQLCSVGGSVRDPALPIDQLRHGLWWNKSKMGLAFAIPKSDSIQVGYVVVSVDKNGQVELGETNFSTGFADKLIIQIDSENASGK